jgi:hypothetical protein
MFSIIHRVMSLGFAALFLAAGAFVGAIFVANTHIAAAQYRFMQPATRPHAYYGFQYVSKSFTPTSTGFATLVVYCPANYVVTGGGFDTGQGFDDIIVRSSHYAGAKQAWQVGYYVYATSNTVTVYAVCAQ